jgi:hypothetical protein
MYVGSRHYATSKTTTGFGSVEDIKYAILEKSGGISIIPIDKKR